MDIRICVHFAVATLCGLALVSCGSPASHNLQSISVSPLSVAGGGIGVQFTATGHWSSAPVSTTPLTAHWGVCQNEAPTTLVTVTQAGLATCEAGAKGTYTVFAADPPTSGPVCNAITACGGGCQISGSAALTCP